MEEDNGKVIHKLSLGVRLIIVYSLVNMIICLIISGLITYKVAPEEYIGKTDRLSVVGSVFTGATNSLGLSILLFVLTQLVIVVIYVLSEVREQSKMKETLRYPTQEYKVLPSG